MKKNAFVANVQKSRKPFCAKDHIHAINIFRIALNGKSFTKEELQVILKNGGIPSNEVFISELRRSSVLTQVSKDRFRFTTNYPVYYGVLEKVYKDYQKRTSMYNQTYRKKKKQLAEIVN